MTKLPKKRKIVKTEGAARRRVLSVILLLLRNRMTKDECAKRSGLSRRTVERVLDDAQSVGFSWSVDNNGHIVLTHERK